MRNSDSLYYDDEPTIYSLTDADGKLWEFELLDEMDLGDDHYFALTPSISDRKTALSENPSLVVMRTVLNEQTGEEEMETVAEDELERIGNIFMERLGLMEDALYEDEDWE